jgi:hypothetical protein
MNHGLISHMDHKELNVPLCNMYFQNQQNEQWNMENFLYKDILTGKYHS